MEHTWNRLMTNFQLTGQEKNFVHTYIIIIFCRIPISSPITEKILEHAKLRLHSLSFCFQFAIREFLCSYLGENADHSCVRDIHVVVDQI